MSEQSGWVKIGLGLGAVAALLIVILVPTSFSGLEYDEMGFLQSSVDGTVELDEVYEASLHFVGVTKKFKIFKADAHLEDFPKLGVFIADKISLVSKINVKLMRHKYCKS